MKTRLGHVLGMQRAAELAAAALLDTLAVCVAAYGVGRCHLALDGDLAEAERSDELLDATADWTVHPQRGADFATRLVSAHRDVADASGAPVVQVGMDTPHLEAGTLTEVGSRLTDRGRRGHRAGVRRWLVAPRSRWPAPGRAPGRGADVDRAHR